MDNNIEKLKIVKEVLEVVRDTLQKDGEKSTIISLGYVIRIYDKIIEEEECENV